MGPQARHRQPDTKPDTKPGWFGVFPGQAAALAALQSRLGDPDPKQVDFVQQIDAVAAFATEYFVPNRPVVVGAGASDALIGGFTDRVAKKMSRRKLSKIKATVQVGRVPCESLQGGMSHLGWVIDVQVGRVPCESLQEWAQPTRHVRRCTLRKLGTHALYVPVVPPKPTAPPPFPNTQHTHTYSPPLPPLN